MTKSIFVLLMLWGVSSLASAQLVSQGPPTHFVGEFVSYTEDSITLKRDDGIQMIVPMHQGWFVAKARVGDLSEIKVGTFLASRNLPIDDMTGESQEIRFYGDRYRPEWGSHMMGNSPTAMTHGDVAAINQTARGMELLITYPNGQRTLVVPEDIPVEGYIEYGMDVLKPGVHLDVVARKDAEGILRAHRVTLE